MNLWAELIVFKKIYRTVFDTIRHGYTYYTIMDKSTCKHNITCMNGRQEILL